MRVLSVVYRQSFVVNSVVLSLLLSVRVQCSAGLFGVFTYRLREYIPIPIIPPFHLHPAPPTHQAPPKFQTSERIPYSSRTSK